MEKIAKAKAVNAQDGVDYNDEDEWPQRLKTLVPREIPYPDAVIAGADRDIVGSAWKLVVNRGITSLGQLAMPMQRS